ncbi:MULTISPECIES: HepT-like ribonuclease domain-containing protein [Thermodesulfovibrio]|uniref:HepT-like ribonuclease domain-containing protein n=1 Tax=Thermodesulfovibrio yellowstonii TaxID=28262 RepID=UPI0004007A14|nr:DUF86 domain-containing protein [Thermodesulfovibrio islandicus]
MSKRDLKLYIKDILNAIDSIEQFIEGMNYEDFIKDDKTSSAVIRKFEIIGEASKNIPVNFKKKYSDVQWKEMAGFRDKLIHFYFGIKYELVWETIKLKLPALKIRLAEILNDLNQKKKNFSDGRQA